MKKRLHSTVQHSSRALNAGAVQYEPANLEKQGRNNRRREVSNTITESATSEWSHSDVGMRSVTLNRQTRCANRKCVNGREHNKTDKTTQTERPSESACPMSEQKERRRTKGKGYREENGKNKRNLRWQTTELCDKIERHSEFAPGKLA